MFLDPEEPIEEFRLAGVFRQAQMDVMDAISRHHRDLRFVLFELFLSIGFGSVIGDYIHGSSQSSNSTTGTNKKKSYALEDPQVVQSWCERTFDQMSNMCEKGMYDILLGNVMRSKKQHGDAEEELHNEAIPRLQGLRLIAMSLVKRFYDENVHLFQIQLSEIQEIQLKGMQELYTLVLKIQSLIIQLQSALWIEDQSLTYDPQTIRHYYSARHAARVQCQDDFGSQWQVDMDHHERSDVVDSKLVIDVLHETLDEHTLAKLPPDDPTVLYHMFDQSISSLIESYHYSQELTPVVMIKDLMGSAFNQQCAVLLYFCLEMKFHALIQSCQLYRLLPQDVMLEIQQTASSFAKTLEISVMMRNAVLSFWFIDVGCYGLKNTTSSLSDPAVQAQNQALSHAFVQISVQNLLDPLVLQSLNLNFIQVLIQSIQFSGNNAQLAWVLLQGVGADVVKELCPIVRMGIYLDNNLWEEGWAMIKTMNFRSSSSSTCRRHNLLLHMWFQWFEKHGKIPLLLEQSLIEPDELRALEQFLIQPRGSPRNVASPESLQMVDFLIAFYLLRGKMERAKEIDQWQREAIVKTGKTQIFITEATCFGIRSKLLQFYQSNQKAVLFKSRAHNQSVEDKQNPFIEALKEWQNRDENEAQKKKLTKKQQELQKNSTLAPTIEQRTRTPTFHMNIFQGRKTTSQEEEENEQESTNTNFTTITAHRHLKTPTASLFQYHRKSKPVVIDDSLTTGEDHNTTSSEIHEEEYTPGIYSSGKITRRLSMNKDQDETTRLHQPNFSSPALVGSPQLAPTMMEHSSTTPTASPSSLRCQKKHTPDSAHRSASKQLSFATGSAPPSMFLSPSVSSSPPTTVASSDNHLPPSLRLRTPPVKISYGKSSKSSSNVSSERSITTGRFESKSITRVSKRLHLDHHALLSNTTDEMFPPCDDPQPIFMPIVEDEPLLETPRRPTRSNQKLKTRPKGSSSPFSFMESDSSLNPFSTPGRSCVQWKRVNIHRPFSISSS